MTNAKTAALPFPLGDHPSSDAIVAKPLEKKKRVPLSSLSINAPVPTRKSSRLGDTEPTENAPNSKLLMVDTTSIIIVEEPQRSTSSNSSGLYDHGLAESHLAVREVFPIVMAFDMKIQNSVSTSDEISSTSIRPKRNRKPNVPHNVPQGKKAKITLATHIKKYGESHQIEIY
jgi:hypothetical protein